MYVQPVCVKTHQVVIKKADDVTFTAATVTPTCQGSATGNIILKDIKGDGNFKVSYGNAGTPVIATYAGITTNTLYNQQYCSRRFTQ